MENHKIQIPDDLNGGGPEDNYKWSYEDFPPLPSTPARPIEKNSIPSHSNLPPTPWSGQQQYTDQALRDTPATEEDHDAHSDSANNGSAETISLASSPPNTPNHDSLSNNTNGSPGMRNGTHGLATTPCPCAEVVAQLVYEAMHNLVTEFKLRRQQDVARMRELQAEIRRWKRGASVLAGGLAALVIVGGMLGLSHWDSEQNLTNMWFC